MRAVEVDARKVIPDKVTRVVGENQELCSTCQGLGLILKGEYILKCPNCFNGIIKKCKFCGEELHPYQSHTCEQMHEQWQEEQRKKALDRWTAAKKIPLKKALANLKMLYSDLSDEYILADEFKDWLADYLEESEGGLPLVYATKTTSLTLNVYAILGNESDLLHVDALDNISTSKITELQNFLDQWCKDVANDTLTYWPYYKIAVMLEE